MSMMQAASVTRVRAWPLRAGGRAPNAQARAVKDVFMPALSSTMTEGKVVTWLKSEGDKVAKGEALVVVESDKADMDVESFEEGYLGLIVVQEGGTADVGSPIAFIAETEGEIADAKAKASGNGSAPAAPAPAAEAPKAAPSQAAAPPPPAPAPAAAAPSPSPPAAPPQNTPPPAPTAPSGPAPRADGRIIATPYAKQLAKKLGVDLSKVGGSGPQGRITATDVERTAGVGASPAPTAAAASPAPPAPAPAAAPKAAEAAPAVVAAAASAGTTVAELRGTTAPFNTLEKAVSKNMVQSKLAPEFRCTSAICTDAFDALYKELKPRGVTMSAMIAKACGIALQSHPRLFASCTPDGMGVTYNKDINIANAVSMADGGLITPVLKACDTTDIYSLSRTWGDLVKRARVKQLTPAEFSDFTFTVSNLGMMGVESFDALLPYGTGAILAVGASVPTVVADNKGMIGVKKIMKVNITCDHRIIYGNHAADFLLTLKDVIENPDVLLR